MDLANDGLICRIVFSDDMALFDSFFHAMEKSSTDFTSKLYGHHDRVLNDQLISLKDAFQVMISFVRKFEQSAPSAVDSLISSTADELVSHNDLTSASFFSHSRELFETKEFIHTDAYHQLTIICICANLTGIIDESYTFSSGFYKRDTARNYRSQASSSSYSSIAISSTATHAVSTFS
jgi:hypothetical protein